MSPSDLRAAVLAAGGSVDDLTSGPDWQMCATLPRERLRLLADPGILSKHLRRSDDGFSSDQKGRALQRLREQGLIEQDGERGGANFTATPKGTAAWKPATPCPEGARGGQGRLRAGRRRRGGPSGQAAGGGRAGPVTGEQSGAAAQAAEEGDVNVPGINPWWHR